MKVYVLLHWWDNDENEGRAVLGVYADPNGARAEMRRNAQEVKEMFAEEFDDWVWDDYSEETEDEIYLVNGVDEPGAYVTSYSWEVIEYEVR